VCDTIGIVGESALFAKNSDRSPNEPQVVECIPAARHSEKNLKTTYITVEQVPETRALLLSRPVWLWGGEMGVNDRGVAIGNEAVFTKGKYGAEALTGMDLLRLALERAETAKQALETIIALLERYGQGGNCGFDHRFEYDNAFLIMDKTELFVLDTCGRQWAYKSLPKAGISNVLNVGADADRRSEGGCDFAKKHRDPLFTYFSGAEKRRACTIADLTGEQGASGLMRTLRRHDEKAENPFARGTVSSVCMHAGGLVGDHTTQSMVVSLDGPAPLVWLTGSSTPCVSLFKPYLFGNEPVPPVFAAGDPAAQNYWLERERFNRRFIGANPPAGFYAERDALEAAFAAEAAKNAANPEAMRVLSADALRKEREFFSKWEKLIQPGGGGSARFRRYWNKKNAALGKGRPRRATA